MKKLVFIMILMVMMSGLFASEGGLLIDIGADLTFYMLNEDDRAAFEAENEGLGDMVNFILFLATLRVGPIVDILWQQSENSWFGFETGLLAIQYGEDPAVVAFNLPLYLVLRFRLGPLFLQPYGGMVFLGFLDESNDDAAVFGSAYELGSKFGLSLGDMDAYLICGAVYSQAEDLAAGSFLMKYGLGASFSM